MCACGGGVRFHARTMLFKLSLFPSASTMPSLMYKMMSGFQGRGLVCLDAAHTNARAMCMCTRTHAFACMHTCVHTPTHLHALAIALSFGDVNARAHAHLDMRQMCLHTQKPMTHTRLSTRVYTHTSVLTCLCACDAHECMQAHTHMHTRVRACTHIHTHARTCARSWSFWSRVSTPSAYTTEFRRWWIP